MKVFIAISGVLAAVFGLALLLMPAQFYQPTGIAFTPMLGTIAQAHGYPRRPRRTPFSECGTGRLRTNIGNVSALDDAIGAFNSDDDGEKREPHSH